jgi:mannose-6-phosphate isomerase
MFESKPPVSKSSSPPMDPPVVREVQRPWGKFRQYAHNVPCTVSLMTVKAGQRLSLQSHRDRSELWIVLNDKCEIQIGETLHQPDAGTELWIPASTPHRLGGRAGDAQVLEIAFGNWQQNDITRYQDDYGRE